MSIPDLNLGGGAGLHGDEAIALARAVNAVADEYTTVVTGAAASASIAAAGVLATDTIKSAIYHDAVTPDVVDVTGDAAIIGDGTVEFGDDTSDGKVVLVVRRAPGT